MASQSAKRGLRLRAVLIPIYVPTFILCICSAAIINHVLPAIGLIPSTISFVSSCIIAVPAWRKRHHQLPEDDEAEHDENFRRWPVSKHIASYNTTPFILFVDTFIAVSTMIVLVCTWTMAPWERYYYHQSPGNIVLATYTTVPMLFMFFAHSWLGILDIIEIYQTLRLKRTRPAECPNCHARFHSSTGQVAVHQGDRAEDYTINRPSEETPFRDTSFDSDVAIQPAQHETETIASKAS